MRLRHFGAALLAAALVVASAAPAQAADNYVVRDGLGAPQTFCSKFISALQYPCHMLYGLFGGAAVPVNVDALGNIGMFSKYGDAAPVGSTPGSGNLVSLSGATSAGGDLNFTANAQTVVIDTQGYASVSLQVAGFGTGAVQVAWSDKSTTGFVAGAIRSVGNTGNAADATSITANGQYVSNGGGRYLQISTTAFTTGPFVVTPVLHTGHVPARSVLAQTVPSAVSSSNGSTTVTTGNTYQTVFGSSSSRKGCLIQNPSSATEVLNVRVGGAAVFTLPIGAAFNCSSPGGIVISDLVEVTAPTTGHAFSALSQ